MKEIGDKGILGKNKYFNSCEINEDYIFKAIQFVLKKIDANLDIFMDKFPSSSSIKLIYNAEDGIGWAASFWTGMLWLAYEITGDRK